MLVEFGQEAEHPLVRDLRSEALDPETVEAAWNTAAEGGDMDLSELPLLQRGPPYPTELVVVPLIATYRGNAQHVLWRPSFSEESGESSAWELQLSAHQEVDLFFPFYLN